MLKCQGPIMVVQMLNAGLFCRVQGWGWWGGGVVRGCAVGWW